jgi:hypothetical protein
LRNAMSQKACFASWKTCSRKATALGSRCIAGGGCSTLRLASAPRIWVRLGVFPLAVFQSPTRRNPGHCHPKVSRAAADQCLKLVHGQVSSPRSLLAYSEPMVSVTSHITGLIYAS